MSDTSIRVKQDTYKKIVEARGILESEDGQRRSINDVLDEVLDVFKKQG